MLLQSDIVPFGERMGEFDLWVALSGMESLVRERETAEEPQEAFCCGSFFLGLFVEREELEGGGLGGMGEVPSADFL